LGLEEAFLTIGRLVHRVTLFAEGAGNASQQLRFIFDDEKTHDR
jgi:hypothetical protein